MTKLPTGSAVRMQPSAGRWISAVGRSKSSRRKRSKNNQRSNNWIKEDVSNLHQGHGLLIEHGETAGTDQDDFPTINETTAKRIRRLVTNRNDRLSTRRCIFQGTKEQNGGRQYQTSSQINARRGRISSEAKKWQTPYRQMIRTNVLKKWVKAELANLPNNCFTRLGLASATVT